MTYSGHILAAIFDHVTHALVWSTDAHDQGTPHPVYAAPTMSLHFIVTHLP